MARILYPITSTFLDYPSPEDNALVVVMMGCNHSCVDCQNPEFKCPQNKTHTKEKTPQELYEDLKILSTRHRTNKIVLSGGDPLSSFNISFTKELIELLSSDYDICVYTGHDIKYVSEHKINATFIKCGNFIPTLKQESFKTDNKMQFASKNQKLFNQEYCLLSENGLYLFH